MMSPILKSETSTSIGSAPASCVVLKNVGAILLPSTTPPLRLFGIRRNVVPKKLQTEFESDLRERTSACLHRLHRLVRNPYLLGLWSV